MITQFGQTPLNVLIDSLIHALNCQVTHVCHGIISRVACLRYFCLLSARARHFFHELPKSVHLFAPVGDESCCLKSCIVRFMAGLVEGLVHVREVAPEALKATRV